MTILRQSGVNNNHCSPNFICRFRIDVKKRHLEKGAKFLIDSKKNSYLMITTSIR